MLAVHFGAGNIGRGFIGNLLFHSGYRTVFVDVNRTVVDLLNEKGEYHVVLADESEEDLLIKDVSAINSQTNPDQVIVTIAKADLVTAAVGPNILPMIAGLIADGLKKRSTLNNTPLNIIACENMIGGSTLLKEKVYERLTDDEKSVFDKQFGFPDAAVDRIVPNQDNEDKLMVKVEPFYEWAVDESKIVGENPLVEGITFVKDLNPYIERKLFTVNTGHAVAAYSGYYYQKKTIDEAMSDNRIKEKVESTLQETGKILIKKHGFDPEMHQNYIQKIVKRFTNPYITDEVTRVGRSPIRKLGPNDRFISPARQYNQLLDAIPIYLATAIATVLFFDYPEDQEAVELQEFLKTKGAESTLVKYTGLDKDSALLAAVLEQYQKLKNK